jgi:hypothetical protein
VQTALAWIRQAPRDVRALPAATDEDQLVAAVLRVGLPFATGDAVFNDDARGGAWILDGDAWRFRPGARAGDSPRLSFKTALSRSRTRGIVAVSYICGNLCGEGYSYLLSRDTDGWKVRAVSFTWVS